MHKESDLLLNKNYFELNQKSEDEPGCKGNTYVCEPRFHEKNKLESMILMMNNQNNSKSQMIREQESDLKSLNRRINKCEKKLSAIYGPSCPLVNNARKNK